MDKKSFATFYSLRLQNKTAQGTEFYFGIQLRKVFAFMQQLVWPAKRPPVMNAMCACVYARRRSHFDDIISYQIIAQVQVRKKKLNVRSILRLDMPFATDNVRRPVQGVPSASAMDRRRTEIGTKSCKSN